MNITLDMLLISFFKKYPNQRSDFSASQNHLQGIRLLPLVFMNCSPDYLYIIDRYMESDFKKLNSNIPIICFLPDRTINSSLPNVTIIHTEIELADAFNNLQQCYNDFTEWGRQLDFAVFKNADYQEFIDISAEMIQDPILIYDPALKLLAFSKNQLQFQDHIYQSAITRGYLDLETVQHFEKTKIFEKLNGTGIAVGEVDSFRQHADIICSININNELAIYCVLLYKDSLQRNYINQLFDILCDSLQQLLKKQHSTFLRDRSVTDYFLMDLLDNPDTPVSQIKERICYNDLEYEGNYILLTAHSEIQKLSSEKYFIQFLRNNIVNCRIFSYKNVIVVLYSLPISAIPNYKDYLEKQLTPILDNFSKNNIHIYVSKPFQTIGEFASAYIQAENTCKIVDSNLNTKWNYYEEHWISDLFLQNTAKDKIFNYCETGLQKMLSLHNGKPNQQLQILYEYLNCDRKLTKTAEKLNMHRNNVIYHIKQIESTYSLDLNDPQTRLKLLLSFEVLKFTRATFCSTELQI